MTIDFEITQDREFLMHFWDCRNIFKLSPEMVEKLRRSEDPYGRYGYGQWLYRVRPDGDESLKEAKACFEYASENGVADAKQMLSYMIYIGDFYSEDKGIWEKNDTMSLILNVQAQEEGSELAVIRKNFDIFHGFIVPADRAKAIEYAEKMAADPDASLLWTEQLGWYYDMEDRKDEAIKAYEKCIEGGLYGPMIDLAFIYCFRGDMAKYESLLEEGVEKGVAACMLWGYDCEEHWDELSPEQQEKIHSRLEKNLYKGVELGDAVCAYALATYKIEGLMGFDKDVEEGLRIAKKGVSYHSKECCNLILDIMATDGIEDKIPEEMILSDEEYAMMVLKAVRYGDESRMESIARCSDEFIDMGYGEEAKYWAEEWKKMQKEETEEAVAEPVDPVEKTEIVPTVLVIHPSGYTEFEPADVNPMSFSEMGALIDANGVDAVHFSNPLTLITKKSGLNKNVAMYVDKDAVMKDLEDNAVATMLYGRGYEIRGAVIIAMEDDKYDTYSFETEEDIEAVFEAIDEMTGLLRRETDDDGRYDPWA